MSGSTLFNEAQLLHLLRVEFSRARRYHQPLSVIMVGIDRLEDKVDLWGLEARTRILEAVQGWIGQAIRISDFMGLYEQDRLLLVLPHTEVDGALVLGRRLRSRAEAEKVDICGRETRLTLSLGLSATPGQEILFHDALLGQCEKALHLAEERGGNRLEVYPLNNSGPRLV